jgi:hypothetical protein
MINIRHFTRRDTSPVLELLHADQLPFQPRCTARDVQHALAGKATIDRNWWEALATIRTIVATEGKDVVGVAFHIWQKADSSQALQPDGSGRLLWLHAREDRLVIKRLLTAVLEALQACPRIYAFWFATPLTVGIEGFPFAYRPVTQRVLLEQHFKGNDDWLYMAGTPVSQADQVAAIETTTRGWQLSLKENGEMIANARVSLGRSHIGVLHWLWVPGRPAREWFRHQALLTSQQTAWRCRSPDHAPVC